MKTIKNRLLFILTLFVSVGLTAQNAPISTIAGVSACPGNPVSVTVKANGFTNITTMTVYISYNPGQLTYVSTANTAGLPNFIAIESALFGDPTLRVITVQFMAIGSSSNSLPANSTVFTMNFNFVSGNPSLNFVNNSNYDCEFTGPSLVVLNDDPVSTYYISGGVTSLMPGTGNISGPTSVTPGTNGLVYSTTIIPNATSYSWSVPSGFNIVSGSGSASVTVNATLQAVSGNVGVQGVNSCGNGPLATLAVSTSRQLSVKVFPEGLFNGTGLNKAQGSSGNQFPGTTADLVTVSLHDAADFSNVVLTLTGLELSTTGMATSTISNSFSGSYYISISHRNSLQIASAAPVSFSASTVSYDFTDAANKAYGNNMKPSGGSFLMFAGDINQDGRVDGLDLIAADNQSAAFATGYIAEDINGDGSVNSADIQMIHVNAGGFASTVLP